MTIFLVGARLRAMLLAQSTPMYRALARSYIAACPTEPA
jgi:hypothetical protein